MAAFVALVFGNPASAVACNASAGGRCYGVAYWAMPAGGNLGANVTLRSDCMSLGDPANRFIANGLWVGSNQDFDSWVETGISKGSPSGNTRTYYWATKRPNGTYTEHNSTSNWSSGTDYFADITHLLNEPSGTWQINVGTWGGTTTNNFAEPAHALETGLETTSSDSPSTHGASKSISWYDSTGYLNLGWQNAGNGSAILHTVGDGNASWATTYTRVNHGIGDAC